MKVQIVGKNIELVLEWMLNNSHWIASSVEVQNIPGWMSVTMSVIFALLWTITMLPHTLIVRNVCLVLGALLGAYVVVKNSKLLLKKQALPIWLIFSLFIWISWHLLFIGSDYDSQLSEFQSIWKRAALGSLFAIGFGIAVVREKTIKCWLILLAGFAMPILIYGFKYLLTFCVDNYGINTPDYLRLYYTNTDFYVPKISYIFFCLPVFGLALGQLEDSQDEFLSQFPWLKAVYLFFSFGVLSIFLSIHAKNGMAYSLVLGILFVVMNFKKIISKRLIWILLIISGLSFFIWAHVQKNESWTYIAADFKAAVKANPNTGDGAFVLDGPYPTNELGVPVHPENYVRFAWGLKALDLIKELPLGYGVIQDSFGRLMKEKWPLTKLGQSHSGWLDLALGIGIPGVVIIIFAAFLAIKNSLILTPPWRSFVPWFLGSSMLLLVSTEVAQKDYLETFIYLIVFAAALSLGSQLANLNRVNLS